jgi:hypothetical protein
MHLLNHDLTRQLNACTSQRRRNGKVARLPHALREQVNRMIEDGVPYQAIIQNLGEAGKHLTEQNLSMWRKGGFQDYYKSQLIKDRARAQTEAAADVLKDQGLPSPMAIQQTCTQIAMLQSFEVVMRTGGEALAEALKRNPAKMITLANSCCGISAAARQATKQKWQAEDRQRTIDQLSKSVSDLPHETNPISPNMTQKK